jgi:hypothetical protein
MANPSEWESAIPPPQDNVASMDGGQLDVGHVILKPLEIHRRLNFVAPIAETQGRASSSV